MLPSSISCSALANPAAICHSTNKRFSLFAPLRAAVSTSPGSSLSRGGEEDPRRTDSPTATSHPHPANQALPRVSWIILKPEPRRFLCSRSQEPAWSSRASPQRADALRLATAQAAKRCPQACALRSTEGRAQAAPTGAFSWVCYSTVFRDCPFSGRQVLSAEVHRQHVWFHRGPLAKGGGWPFPPGSASAGAECLTAMSAHRPLARLPSRRALREPSDRRSCHSSAEKRTRMTKCR